MCYTDGAKFGIVVAGGNEAGIGDTQLYSPRGLHFDSASNSLFIANAGAHNVVQWEIGKSSWTLVVDSYNGPELQGCTSQRPFSPEDVALDSMGNVYVADTPNHRVLFFLAGQSNGTTIAGTCKPGHSDTLLNMAMALVVDTQFNVYVADYNNHRVQKFEHLKTLHISTEEF
jgi:DNA-binding beta-propeller fold protein YncE